MIAGTIDCIGKDKLSATFYYRYTPPGSFDENHKLSIFATSDYSDSDFFELIATKKDENTLKIILIKKHDDELYGAKGIPDSAIPELQKLTGKSICSSSNKNPSDLSERRTEDATKFWDRLVSHGKATYDNATDVYTYT